METFSTCQGLYSSRQTRQDCVHDPPVVIVTAVSYIGQTGRAVQERIKEHERHQLGPY